MIENYLQRVPFFRLLVSLIGGILAILFSPFFPLKTVIIVTAVTLLFTIWAVSGNGWHRNRISAVLLNLLLFCVGATVMTTKNQPKNYTSADGFLVTLLEKPVEKPKSYRAEVLVTSQLLHDSLHFVNEKLVVYFQKDSSVVALHPGDRIVFAVDPQIINNQGNPYEFDYKKYLQRRGMERQVYLKSGLWSFSGTDPKLRLTVLAEKTRDNLLRIYERKGLSGNELAILSALTLGYKKSLDPEVKQAFSSTGAMHVLAVSGLHVGIIYMVFKFFFGFLLARKSGRYVFVILAFTLLWGFAFITGLAPSVQRAALMFSLIILGEQMRRPSNIYNSLAASAFVLLVVNPNLLFEVGFQLSYAAVTGIVFFQPKIAGLITFNTKFPKYLWGLFTVSIAAQLATFPITCYYFNQFPIYFWISNFIVIPAAFLFILLGILILVFSPITLVSSFLAVVSSFLLKIMFAVLQWIGNLPGALYSGFNFPAISLIISLLVVIILAIFIESRRKVFLFSTMALVLLFIVSATLLKIQNKQHREIIMYKTDKPVVHLIAGKVNYIIADGDNYSENFPSRETETVISALNLNQPVFIPIDNDFSNQMVYKRGNLILFLDKIISLNGDNALIDSLVRPDIFVTSLTNSSSVSFPLNVDIVNYTKKMIADSLFANVFFVHRQGAYRLKF